VFIVLSVVANGRSAFESTENQEVLTTFHCFQELPVEIRLKVWRETCRVHRIVEIICNLKRPKWNKFASRTPAPALLHACQEARMEGLRHYEMLPGYGDRRRYRETYVNWDVDSIFLDRDETLDSDIIIDVLDVNQPTSKLQENCRHLIYGLSPGGIFI
jgi:hypothetical protein